jgi:hypothetical protein
MRTRNGTRAEPPRRPTFRNAKSGLYTIDNHTQPRYPASNPMQTPDLRVVRVGGRDCRRTSWGSASPVRTGRSTIVLAESLVSQPRVPSPGSPLLGRTYFECAHGLTLRRDPRDGLGARPVGRRRPISVARSFASLATASVRRPTIGQAEWNAPPHRSRRSRHPGRWTRAALRIPRV